MGTRGEAQAALDSYIERTGAQPVTDYVRHVADVIAAGAADMMSALFARLEVLSEDEVHGPTAVAVAEALFHLASDINSLVELAVGTALELDGDRRLVADSPAWKEHVAGQQTLVDALPDMDDETQAILDDADAMAAIEEAEQEEAV